MVLVDPGKNLKIQPVDADNGIVPAWSNTPDISLTYKGHYNALRLYMLYNSIAKDSQRSEKGGACSEAKR